MHYFACGSETLLVELQKPNTYVNHGFDETRTQNRLITSGENSSLGK